MKLILNEYGVNDLMKRIRFLESDIEDAGIEIVNELINMGTTTAGQFDAMAPHSSNKENTSYTVKARVYENSVTGCVGLQGPGIIYDEFGTGNEGAANPHPLKENFGLNPYNSGPVVSKNVNIYGHHYWFYKPGVISEPNYHFPPNGYTEGIPAGKQVYNTSRMLQKEKNKVAKSILNRYLPKYNK